MTTPSTGAPQPRDRARTEDPQDPVEAFEENVPTPEELEEVGALDPEDMPGAG